MEVFEIIVISCQENQALTDSIEQVTWVCRAVQQRGGRHHNLVARLPEPGNQGALGAVVIEIEIHDLAGAAAGA
jgi:hypothetical protein